MQAAMRNLTALPPAQSRENVPQSKIQTAEENNGSGVFPPNPPGTGGTPPLQRAKSVSNLQGTRKRFPETMLGSKDDDYIGKPILVHDKYGRETDPKYKDLLGTLSYLYKKTKEEKYKNAFIAIKNLLFEHKTGDNTAGVIRILNKEGLEHLVTTRGGRKTRKLKKQKGGFIYKTNSKRRTAVSNPRRTSRRTTTTATSSRNKTSSRRTSVSSR